LFVLKWVLLGNKIFLVSFLLVISLFLLFGCTQSGSGSLVGSDLNGARFVDLENNAIFDSNTGLTWMKCNYGESGNNCVDGRIKEAPIGVTTNTSPVGGTSFCFGTDSADAYCKNGVLCTDGSFVTVDWKTDSVKYPAEYPANTSATGSCYVQAPNTSKERACSSHGGVAFNSWRVPAISELESIFEQNKSPAHIDSTFFPTARDPYLSIDADLTNAGGVVNVNPLYKTFFYSNNNTSSTSTSANLRCVSDEAPDLNSVMPEGGFCSATFPYKLHVTGYMFRHIDNGNVLTDQGKEYFEIWVKANQGNILTKEIRVSPSITYPDDSNPEAIIVGGVGFDVFEMFNSYGGSNNSQSTNFMMLNRMPSGTCSVNSNPIISWPSNYIFSTQEFALPSLIGDGESLTGPLTTSKGFEYYVRNENNYNLLKNYCVEYYGNAVEILSVSNNFDDSVFTSQSCVNGVGECFNDASGFTCNEVPNPITDYDQIISNPALSEVSASLNSGNGN